MLRSRKTMSLALSALLIGAFAIPGLGVYGAEQDKPRAEVFMEMAKKALESTISLRDLAKSKGIDVTRMNELITRGEELLSEAKVLFGKNDFGKAVEKTREAMKVFADAIRSLGGTLDREDEDREVGKGILEAISRHRKRIAEILSSLPGTAGAPQKLVDAVNKVKSLLNDAEKLLKEAEDIIKSSPSNASEAAKRMADANKKLGEANKALKDVLNHGDKDKFDKFTKGIEKELDKLEKLIKDKGGNSAAAKAKLAEAEKLIKDARSKAEKGDVKDVLKDIKEARDLLHQIEKDLRKDRDKDKERGKEGNR